MPNRGWNLIGTNAGLALMVLGISSQVLAQAPPAITSVLPARNATSVERSSAVTATFSADMNAATITSSTFRVRGEQSGPKSGAVTYSTGNRSATFTPSTPFFAGERVFVQLTSGIQATNGATLTNGYAFSFRAKVNGQGGIQLSRGTEWDASTFMSPAAGDLNGDGRLDLFVGLNSYGYRVMLFTGSSPTITDVQTTNIYEARLADFDGDGDLDVVGLNNNVLTFLWNSASGTFPTTTSISTSWKYFFAEPADLDADGDIDLLGTAGYLNASFGLHSYLNDDSGNFTHVYSAAGSSFEMLPTVDDVNGDGIVDVVTPEHYTNPGVYVYLGTGGGAFSAPTFYPRGGAITNGGATLDDLDGDGDLDFPVGQGNEGLLAVLANAGNGSFNTGQTLTGIPYPSGMSSADMDGNGTIDLVYHSSEPGLSLVVLANNGNSLAVGANIPLSPGYPARLALGDIDNDGDVDAFVSMVTSPLKLIFFENKSAAGPDLQIAARITFARNRDGNPEIYVMNADGSGQIRLTNNLVHDAAPSWSPDGAKIAYTSVLGRGDILVTNVDQTGTPINLTNHPATDSLPSWSPDGKQIAFYSDRDGNGEIYLMNAAGSGLRPLSNNPARDASPSWSPTGTRIAFHSDRDGNAEIYVMNADGTNQTRLTNNSASDFDPSWSPDSTKIAFWSNRDGNAEIYVMNADGTNQTRVTNDPAGGLGRPSWSPDGSKMVFTLYPNDFPEVYMINADGSNQTPMFYNPPEVGSLPSWEIPYHIGSTSMGNPISRNIKIKNMGMAALNVSSIISSDGQFVANPASFSVAVGDSQNVAVSFNPSAGGTQYSLLTINSNDPDAPTAKLMVNGTGQAIAVSVPDTVATYNQSLTVPVRVSQTSGSGIVSFELALLYNRRLLSGATVQTAGTLAEGWTIQSNIVSRADSLDTLKIAAAHSTALSGAGTLLNLNFQVADVRHPASSPLTLVQVLFNTGEIATTQDHGSLRVVGHNGALFSFPDSILPRQQVQVRLWELEENRHPGTAQSVGVQVRNGSQSEMLILSEAGVDTAGFFGSIATAFSPDLSPPSGDGIVQAKAGDRIVFSFVDSLDGSGNMVGRADTTLVMGGKDGRLQTTVVSQPGDTVRVRLTDGDRNFNPGSQDTITMVSAVNGRTGEQEVVRVREVSANDSVFFGILWTTLGSSGGANNDGVMLTRKGDVVAFTYQDTITALGGVAVVPDSDYVVNPFGDADGNGSVQAFDAARVLFHVLSPFIVGIDSLTANVDLLAPFGPISPYDASLTLQKRVGLIGRFPVQEDESDNHPQPETDNSTPKPVVAQRVLSLQPGEGYWSVVADERGGILSGEVVLRGIEGHVELGPELQAYLVASRSGEGGLRVVFAGAVPVSGPGELLRVYPGVGPGRAQLTRAELNDGQLGVVLSGVASTVELPTSYALLGNWPNPFNPETTIGFALPERSVVTLAVYDVLGQRVRVLVGRELPAGQHQVVWDGRDEWGRPVSSGVYLCRMKTGGPIIERKLMLVR